MSSMTYRPLGQCGTKVSVYSLGGWTTYGGSVKEEKLIYDIIKTAFDSGVNFFDIANIYAKGEAEKMMGLALKHFPRHELVISSKVFWPMSENVNDRGLSRKHIMESVEKSLRRTGTEYLDIYFCHRFDPETPMEETARAMDDLVHQGKVLYWGTSEWTGNQIQEIHSICDRRNLYFPQVEQPQYNLLVRQKFETDVLPTAKEKNMGLVVWSPLASGILSGKYDHSIPEGSRLEKMGWLKDLYYKEEVLKKVRKFKDLAESLNCTRSQLALAWCASNPGVSSVITGATSLDQLEENLGALKIHITGEIQKKLDALFPLQGE